jgi:hypothetical protein
MLRYAPREIPIAWGWGSVPITFANIGAAVEKRRAVASARLRIDLFMG